MEIEVKHDLADYSFPELSFLREGEKPSAMAQEALERTAQRLISTLKSFGVEAKSLITAADLRLRDTNFSRVQA